MKFVAPKVDLDLELETLSGQEFKIPGPVSINTEQAASVLKKIEAQDKAILANPVASTSLKVTVGFLVEVYGKDEAFWQGNFPPETLFEIRRWFVNHLAGIKKKD